MAADDRHLSGGHRLRRRLMARGDWCYTHRSPRHRDDPAGPCRQAVGKPHPWPCRWTSRGRGVGSGCGHFEPCPHETTISVDGQWWCDLHSPLRGQALLDTLNRELTYSTNSKEPRR